MVVAAAVNRETKMSGYFPEEGRGLGMVVNEMQQDGGAYRRQAVEDKVETM